MALANKIHTTGQAIVWSGHRELGRALPLPARGLRADAGAARALSALERDRPRLRRLRRRRPARALRGDRRRTPSGRVTGTCPSRRSTAGGTRIFELFRETRRLTDGTYLSALRWALADDDHAVAVYRAQGSAARPRARHRPGAADRPRRTGSGGGSPRCRSTRPRSRRSGPSDDEGRDPAPRGRAGRAPRRARRDGARRRGVRLRLALGRRPPALPRRRPPRARAVGLLDDARLARRHHRAGRARPARRVHRVPSARASSRGRRRRSTS